jgi:hypothetical protein
MGQSVWQIQIAQQRLSSSRYHTFLIKMELQIEKGFTHQKVGLSSKISYGGRLKIPNNKALSADS